MLGTGLKMLTKGAIIESQLRTVKCVQIFLEVLSEFSRTLEIKDGFMEKENFKFILLWVYKKK